MTEAGDAGPGTPATVLVADDDADYRLLVQLALAGSPSFGPVVGAATAEDTLAAAEQRRPDVVLLDVSLKGAFDVASHLTSSAGAPKLVLVSSRPPDELAAVAAAAGAVGYLGKDVAPSDLPFAVADLMHVVDRLESLLATAMARLPADPRSAGDARRMVRRSLEGWCDDERLDDITLCVSELVTNAVLHAHSALRVLVQVRPSTIRVEINDESDSLPVARGAGPEDTSGRGIAILGSLSQRWGTRRRSGGGKTVWFDVARTDAVLESAGR